MRGATGNVYVGLHEFESMGFVLHVLRSSSAFIDVGANVGAYTVLAAGGWEPPGSRLNPCRPHIAAFATTFASIICKTGWSAATSQQGRRTVLCA